MEKNEIKNENDEKNSNIKAIDISIHEVCKSICKITYENKVGTGFFIKLYKDQKDLFCLMTNHHVIKKEIIDVKQVINVLFNYEKKIIQIKLDRDQRFITFNEDMDITIIEILPSDKIKEKYFLFPNLKNKDFTHEYIYIPQFPEG